MPDFTTLEQAMQDLGHAAGKPLSRRGEAHQEVLMERDQRRAGREGHMRQREFNNGSVIGNPTRRGKVGAVY